MSARLTLKVIGTLHVLVGLLALLMIDVFGIYSNANTDDLVPIATLLAAASVIAGIATFARPIVGAGISLFLLIPQAVSFARAPIAYALSLWPTLGIEFNIIGFGDYPFDFSANTQVRLFEPILWLRTDVDYVGFGIGFNVVVIALMAVLVWALLALSRAK